MVGEKRRWDRYPYKVHTQIHLSGTTFESDTYDVCMRGAYLVTDARPALRELFRVSLRLPPTETPFEFLAMAVHPPNQAEVQTKGEGIGIHLFGNSVRVERAWEEFLHYVRTRPDAPQFESADEPWPENFSATTTQEFIPRFILRPETENEYHQTLETARNEARIPVETDVHLGKDFEVHVEVCNPATNKCTLLAGTISEPLVSDRQFGLMVVDVENGNDTAREREVSIDLGERLAAVPQAANTQA